MMRAEASLDPGNRPMIAAMTMVAAMAVIGFIDNFVARVAGDIGLFQFHLMRAILILPMIVAMSRLGLGRLRPRRWRAVAGRSLVLAVSMLLYFGALGLMSISEALAGLFTAPIFILLINAGLMGQRIGPWRILAVGLGFCGILFVLQPSGDTIGPLMAMPVAAGAFYAVSAIATRSWCGGESAMALLAGAMVALGSLGALGLGAIELWGGAAPPGVAGFLGRGWVWPVWHIAPILILQAAGSAAGVYLIIRSYQMDIPSRVSVFEFAVMIFGPFFGWILFGQGLGPLQTFGIGLIVLAGITILLRSR